MAFPTILVHSSGSDTAASGAGPATALTGAGGISAADGLSVILDGSPDLSGVATDGSHVLFYNDTNAGSRNFAKITGTSGSGGPTATVTLSDAVRATQTKAWAIGGKRSAIGTTLSAKLFSNNAASGDAMPGWTVEMESGHTETIAAAFPLRRAGDTTSGKITLKGTTGAGTMPILTFSNNGNMIQLVAAGTNIALKNFELRNTNATKTASIGVLVSSGTVDIRNVRINHATNKPWKGISVTVGVVKIADCDIRNCANIGIELACSEFAEISNNIIKANGSHGISHSGASIAAGPLIHGNIIAGNAGDGINESVSATTAGRTGVTILQNIIDANTGDGIEISSASTALSAYNGQIIENNQITNNGGYGVNYSGSSVTAILLDAHCATFKNNNHSSNTSGLSNLTLTHDENTININPVYVNAAADDYSIGTATKAKGYPLGGTLYVGTTSTTYSYVDPGLQRQEAGGAAAGSFIHTGSGRAANY